MAHNVDIHQAQTSILRELLFKKDASFSELQKMTGLESDYFKFHIAKLVEIGYVVKNSINRYELTVDGKEHANKLDTDNNSIERQPKPAVLLLIDGGNEKYLFQQRLKHPYYGFWGLLGGKIRWGETIHSAAARELKEETGLTADIEFVGVYHEHSGSNEGKLLEDKIFFMMKCTNVTGTLIEEFEGGVNKYMTIDQTKHLDKKYNSFDFELEYALGLTDDGTLVEKQQYYSSDEF